MKKNKEHKKGESTIGKIIYGFLLFMPLFAIGVTCGYAMFNKNAYQSFATKKVQNYTKVTNTTQIIQNKDYMFSFESNFPAGTDYIYFNSIDEWVKNLEPNVTLVAFRFTGVSNFVLRDSNNNDYSRYGYFTNTIQEHKTFNFNFESTGNAENMKNINSFYLINYVTKPISDVFYYSVDKVTESPLFSWATNSVIYTTMNATCIQLSITAPFIPLLLSYWLIISVIYFLYDIALMLIWLLHDKIHEMRDSLA